MKTRLLIYAVNNDKGGGKSVLENILTSYNSLEVSFTIGAFVPKQDIFEYRTRFTNIAFHGFSRFGFDHSLVRALYTLFCAKHFVKKLEFTAVLNITNIPIPFMRSKQFFLFHWPYAVCTDRRVWQLSPIKERYFRYVKKWIFSGLAKSPTAYLVQTRYFMSLLNDQYGIKVLHYFPNSVSNESLNVDTKKYDYLFNDDFINLLVFTSYYSHKNLEVITNVIKLLSQSNNKKRIRFVFTLNSSDKYVERLFVNLSKFANDRVQVLNVGVVQSLDIFSLYRNCSALFLPTVLESFSGTYVEAIYCGKPVITSNLPFAREVLGTSAYYFDPFSVESIVEILNCFFEDLLMERVILCNNKDFLQSTWLNNVENFNTILRNEL